MTTPGDCIVIDNGSGTYKAGFAGESEPRVIEESLVGWQSDEENHNKHNAFLGSEIKMRKDSLTVSRPIERDLVCDWDGAEALWNHIITRNLKVKPEEHPVLITESALNPKANREKTAEIMMESLKCAGVYLSVPGVLSLYSSGHTSGVVLDVGYGQTTVVPVFQGYQLRPGTRTLPMGGEDLTNYLLTMLIQRGYPLKRSAVRDVINTAKEKICYISDDFDAELAETLDSDSPLARKDYELPDGTNIVVDKERFLSVEALFQPQLLGNRFPGIHVSTVEGVIGCDRNVHELLFDNVLLAGGATCTSGLESRLYKEMLLVAPPMTKIRMIPTKPRKRQLSAWIGGAMLTKLDTFDDAYVKRWEYEEYGPSIVHRKCF